MKSRRHLTKFAPPSHLFFLLLNHHVKSANIHVVTNFHPLFTRRLKVAGGPSSAPFHGKLFILWFFNNLFVTEIVFAPSTSFNSRGKSVTSFPPWTLELDDSWLDFGTNQQLQQQSESWPGNGLKIEFLLFAAALRTRGRWFPVSGRGVVKPRLVKQVKSEILNHKLELFFAAATSFPEA